MNVVPLTAELLQQIEPQPMQRLPAAEMVNAMLAPTGTAWCAVVDGAPIAAAGVVEAWENRAYGWGLIGAQARPYMRQITRATRARLDSLPYRRIEMAVDAGFKQAIQWAFMLGFDCETPEPMKHYTPDGRAAYLFARVR